MTDYTTELLHISSYVIGILLGALICTIVMIFYYRKKLRSAGQTDDDRLLFSDFDFHEETTSDLEATPTGEGAGEADAAALEEERTEEKESGKAFEGESLEDDDSVKKAEASVKKAEASAEEPPSELLPPPPPSRRATKAETAEERLYEQVTRVIAEERLYLKPGFGRTDIVERFGISAHRAGMIFSKRQTSIPEFVRNCRLDYAFQKMADEPDASLADIATAAGFIHLSTFIRDFKDRYGMTPARYRESQPIHELQTE